MSVVGLGKLILTDKLKTSQLEVFILRCYEQIITGVWALLIIEPVESLVYTMLGMPEEAHYLTKRFLIIFIVYNIFFILSSIIVPEIKKIRLRRKLHVLTIRNDINSFQRESLKKIINNNLMCKGFFTKYGLIQFFSNAISSVIFIIAYFSCEYFLDIVSRKTRPVELLVIFLIFLFVALYMAWTLDKAMAKVLKRTSRYPSIIPDLKNDKDIKGKELMIQIMQLITKDSFESQTGQALISDFLEDVCQVIYITNEQKISSPSAQMSSDTQ